MLFLETLGRIRLADADGRDIDRLMQQPKRLGLLAYLASPSPGTWHRRDILLGVFWPELDAQRARTALRNALHVLRQHLPAGTIRTRGDDEISIDPDRLTTDAALLDHDLAEGRAADAFARYGGDYLRGLYIRDAELFERWLDDERRRLSTLARRAAIAASESVERAGDVARAAEILERASDLDRHDESILRRVVALHDRAGDRARGLALYERFRIRLFEDLGAEPSAETLAEVTRLRALRGDGPVDAAALPSALPSAVSAPAVAPPSVEPAPVRSTSRRRAWTSVGIGAVATLGIGFAVLRANATPRRERLVILPAESSVADSLAYLGSGIGEDVARRLRGIGGLQTIRPGFGVTASKASIRDLARAARELGATAALRTSLSSRADSLVISAEVVDVASGEARSVGRFAFLASDARDVGSRIAASVAGALFRAPLPVAPRAAAAKPVDRESFAVTMQGWHALLVRDDPFGAKELFLRAIDRDVNNARAWAGLSSVWSALTVTWGEQWDVGAARAEAAANRAIALDSTDGTPWANLANIRAMKSRRVADAEPWFEKAVSLDPGNPEVFMIRAALYRHAWEWSKARDALRIARQLDPLSPFLVERAAILGLCTDRPQESLDLYRAEIALDPNIPTAHRGAARALARLGRWNDALAELRLSTRESTHSDSTGDARTAYWALARQIGRADLKRLEDRARAGWVSPLQIAVNEVAAGNVDRGMSILERETHSGDPGLYRLSCLGQMDAVRETPRFRALLAALPAWER